MNRREFLERMAYLAAITPVGSLVSCGPAATIRHLLPTVSHDRILIKASFASAPASTPQLSVSGQTVAGVPTDTAGKYFSFLASGLSPNTSYDLEMTVDGDDVTDPWSLSTFPHPDAQPSSFRLLAFTCNGGCDVLGLHVDVAIRRRMLERALTFSPDAVVANGDHVYWDLRGPSSLVMGQSIAGILFAGRFDRELPVLGTPNEEVLEKVASCQISDLYGDLFKSTPVFFLSDDHDYFENDYFNPGGLVTFPPDGFSRELAEVTQQMFYPEFLPDGGRPTTLPGSQTGGALAGLSQRYGTLRYGRLFEGLLYDCKGDMGVTRGSSPGIVPADVEGWLTGRTQDGGVDQVVHFPSNPPGWTAGKYAEWYPDVLVDGELSIGEPKPGWEAGWFQQHNRLLQAISQHRSIPLVLSGDIHSIAEGRIRQSDSLDLSSNPVISVITGTPSAAGSLWPSQARGTLAMPSLLLDVEELVSPIEQNGFHLIEFEPGKVTIGHFKWDAATQDPSEIDTLQPFRVSEYTS